MTVSMRSSRRLPLQALMLSLGLAALGVAVAGDVARIPVLVPLTGFLALEGTSQRNGALLALDNPPPHVAVAYDVADTATSPESATTAFERALSTPGTVAVAASMLGTQLLAMVPLADQYEVPLVTVSGTTKITELGSPWVFRFFPTDRVVKEAQARYIVEELGRRRPAVIYQTTAYGQSGREQLALNFERLGATIVFEEGIDPAVKDMLPVLSKAMAADPDVLVLHLHAGPTALVIRHAAAMGIEAPIVAGSAMHQPATAALLEPAELKGVCAETGASPISGGSPEMEAFAATYRKRFDAEPDAFALGQFDGMNMVLEALRQGARTAEDVRRHLAERTYRGLAMTYRSDGTGNMAHDAVVICYDGSSRIPAIVKRYGNLGGA